MTFTGYKPVEEGKECGGGVGGGGKWLELLEFKPQRRCIFW